MKYLTLFITFNDESIAVGYGFSTLNKNLHFPYK